jgi:serine/threonine-protein kinase
VSPLFVDDLAYPEYSLFTKMLRWTVTAIVAGGWAFTRFANPNRLTILALESGVTVGLALVYVHIASAHMGGDVAGFAPVFAMFGIILLLAVRASLVPSPVLRTVAIGIVTVTSLFVVGRDSVRDLDPLVFDGLTFIGGAFVLATAVTSHVIYGLRREVRQALRLGQYTLEEKLGEGGMGSVFRARHALLRREAAIKLIKPALSGDDAHRAQTLRRFEREADVTATLKSPHTVELYDFGVSDEGSFYYVMELLEGIDLETAVAAYGPMPPERVVFALRQICESLEEAHAAGLVHRDIKPANVFLCHHGLRYDFVKVLDFGLVALGPEPQRGHPKLTVDGVTAGTPAYLAPEMATHAGDVDGRADIYSIGCVAYWLLTGHAPFERGDALATILAHVNESPPPPSRLTELAIPESMDALVLACLAKAPADRPSSAAELARRLDESVRASGWDQARAEQWWMSHKPERRASPASAAGDATRRVTKFFP